MTTMARIDNILRWKRYLSVRFIAAKVKDKGHIKCIYAFWHKYSSAPDMSTRQIFIVRIIRAVLCRIRKIIRMTKWVYNITYSPIRFSKQGDSRLLIVYDLSSQPFSIGDILTFQEVSLVLREKYKVNLVDFALVYNPQNPAIPHPAFSYITKDNYTYNLVPILQVAQVNEYLGSLFLFNSHTHLESFIADNNHRYYVWPKGIDYIKKEYPYYKIFNEILYDYYNKNKRIPHLQSRTHLLNWGHSFLLDNVFPSIPITVQIRNNPVSKSRNLCMENWFDFFSHCNKTYPAKFIIICSEAEIDERLRPHPNVLISKDFQTNIEKELALINVSAFHMGASSGPGMMALFSDKPFLIVNTDLIPSLHPLMYKNILSKQGDYIRFCFSNSLQNFISGVETTEILIREFKKMWTSLDTSYWKKIKEKSYSGNDIQSLLR